MDGYDFDDINQLLQRAVTHENRARVGKPYGWFKETASKKKPGVNYVEEDSASDNDDAGVCVAKWVNAAPGKPLSCAFLKPSPRKKDEMKFTFDVTKWDKLFDVLHQNKVIRLSEGHVLPPLGKQWKESIPNDTTHFLITLMIVTSYVDRYNRPWTTVG
jgi:hypothetical protein